MKNLHEVIDRIEKARINFSRHQIVKLLAVSKNVSQKEVLELYNQGQRAFGENRVQELKKKNDELEKYPIEWHFIGTLQNNKINQLISTKPYMWQSCNSYELASSLNDRLNYTLNTLLEINCANENTKSGIEIDKAVEEYLKIKENCKNLNMCGVMSIGAHSEDINKVKMSFEDTYKIFDKLKKYDAKICSMGMSNDFELAINCGSNMVRLGTILY